MVKKEKIKLLVEKLTNDLIELQNGMDRESAHIYADDILCKLLKELGYKELVEEYDKIHKWYA